MTLDAALAEVKCNNNLFMGIIDVIMLSLRLKGSASVKKLKR